MYLRLLASIGLLYVAQAAVVDPNVLDACPGYSASNVDTEGSTITADLKLAGTACNVFGNDTETLKLQVTYETADRIHLKITDPSTERYEVPESVLPRPSASGVSPSDASIQFNYTASPFSFTILRKSTGEALFNTASHPLIFEPQYLRVKTGLPAGANIYGLGEHTQSFRLPTTNTTRTLWSRDAYGTPPGTNLYGNHPVYVEHRAGGTHGVLLLSSNGMDVKINETGAGASLEYNVIGGVLDFYFLAGSESDPRAVARQYAEIVGTPAEVPYWSFGLHQCRFGYNNFVDVADVITNYASAGIPLETMWTDIDYMEKRRIFTVDPDYFPLNRMREVVSYLHSHDQRFVLMTDPAVAYLPNEGYGPYDRGTELDLWMKNPNGSDHLGLVWPGVTVYPDWFHPKIQDYWNNEFDLFYNPETGVDIDGAWIDMNEPASFCLFPCDVPFAQAKQQNLPPPRTVGPPDPNTPIFTNDSSARASSSASTGVSSASGHYKRAMGGFDPLFPQYAIENAAGGISNNTAHTDVKHANGLLEYDTHNIYGTMMSTATHEAMLARRPGERTLVITRSTFPGAGAKVGKWLGDNMSRWEHYRFSIAGMLGMASVYQVPMVGADICGFAENTTEQLCARWATLGGFYPFMRNHNADTSISQEFYRWPTTTQAAKNILDIRYRLMDYFYTTFHQASKDGTPVLNPLWFLYPQDANTFPIDFQFFFGPSILVSPVTDEGATSVTAYLPKDVFYDFLTGAPVQGQGANVTLDNIDFTQIPVHIRGGAVLPLRANGTMTTVELRKTDFELVVAPSAAGEASGTLYADDGVSVSPDKSTTVTFSYKAGALEVSGDFGFDLGVNVANVKILGMVKAPTSVQVNGEEAASADYVYDDSTKVLNIKVAKPFNGPLSVKYS